MEVLSIKKKRTQLNGSTFISGLMVCLWDNIFGPRTEQVWDGLTEVPNEILDNFCRNILCGEISNFDPADTDKNSKNSKTNSKFHLFPQFDYILSSVVFTARFQTTSTKWAICLMVPKSFLKRYLLIHHLIEDHLTFFTCILQQLLENKPASVAMDTLNYHLDLFVTYTNALNNEEKLIREIRFNQSVFANIESDKKMEVKFLALAITSHLQTHGSTVVIGSHAPDIDQMIDTLAIFLTPDERERSSYVVEGRKYIPDLLLQGLLKQRVSDGEAIQSLLPTTIIDLDKQQINQTQAYHIHCLLRKENRKMQVKRAATSSDYYAANSNNNNNNSNEPQLFKQVREASSFIETMLEEVFRLPIVLRKGMLLQIRRLLIRRSIVLIKYVDKKIDGNDILQNSVIRKMRADLQLLSDADFGIALAIAHKYSPNIYYALAGDPATIENKFFELFFL